MEYFGTDLRDHGHFRWTLTEHGPSKRSLNFKGIPFNPEELTKNLPKGSVVFYQGGGFTVLGISGSCVDDRPGTKSIFWVNETIEKSEMVERVKAQPFFIKMIDQMKFKVNL